jgi:hypoxanthine phosphoribosyltransferase
LKLKPNFVKITWQKLEKDCINLSSKLKEKKLDRIVAISRGGLVVARIFSDLLSIPISHITIESYKDLKQDKKPIITELPSRIFHNQTILIVDEISDSGRTFERALGYFQRFENIKIYTLAPYIKPNTKYIPHYYKEKIDGWIIFPYEIQETTTALLKLFKNKNKAMNQLLKIGFHKWEITKIFSKKYGA